MSWLSGLKKQPSTSEADLRAAKRDKLEADRKERLARAKKRANLQKQFQDAQLAQAEADQALQDFLSIDPSIFDGEDFEIDDSNADDLFNEVIENEIMANFDELNTDNGADALKSLGQIKVSWDGENPGYFFQKLETELQIFSINKQFTKRQALIRCLPDDVAKEFMHLVTLQETEAGNLAYKNLKTAIIKAYGPKPGDSFQRALDRVMTGKPSVLLKLLISDICKNI